ncbi:MAG: hypothetical protein H6R00_930 [Proteobacteria bacterium]|nr:hypothetical protein [Pseudomonadota bacterium]
MKTATTEFETKSSAIPLELKAVGENGVIEGYGSVFGAVDSYGEVVQPGAFVDSLVEARRKGRKIKMLYQHDPGRPIGLWDDLAEDAKGLYCKGRLLKDSVPDAATAYALIKEGVIDGLSIGYRTIEAAPHPDKQNVLALKKLDLFEISPVTFQACEPAKIQSVKAAALPQIQKLMAGDRLSLREWEALLKAEPFGLSNSQAERAVRVNLKHGQGEPDTTALAFLEALRTP